MCPGCPTFSIPIPIPKSTLLGFGNIGKKPQPKPKQPPRRAGLVHRDKKPVKYQYSRNQTFLEKVGGRIWNRYQEVYIPILKKADEFLPDVFDPLIDAGQSYLGVEIDENSISEKVDKYPPKEKTDKDDVEEESSGFNFIPVLVGGVSAAALGFAAYLAVTPHTVDVNANSRQARLLNHKSYEEASQIVELIENANDKYGIETEK